MVSLAIKSLTVNSWDWLGQRCARSVEVEASFGARQKSTGASVAACLPWHGMETAFRPIKKRFSWEHKTTTRIGMRAIALLLLFSFPNRAASQCNYGRSIQRWAKPPCTELIPGVVAGVAISEAIHQRQKHVPAEREQASFLVKLRIQSLRSMIVAMPATCTIVAINVLIFALWRVAVILDSVNIANSMSNNLTMPLDQNERSKRPHTIITSGFSHFEKYHLLQNMIALLVFGRQTEQWLGGRIFVSMYVASICGSHLLNLGVLRD